jgi:hypothetical protein
VWRAELYSSNIIRTEHHAQKRPTHIARENIALRSLLFRFMIVTLLMYEI